MTVLVGWQKVIIVKVYAVCVSMEEVITALVCLAWCRVVAGQGNGRERKVQANLRARASDRAFFHHFFVLGSDDVNINRHR
jgi:hypothetical protein